MRPFRSRRLHPWLKRLLRIALGVYLGLIILLAAFQTYFIFPGAATQGRKDVIVHDFDGGRVVMLTARTGEQVATLFGHALTPDGHPHPDAAHRPTIIYFYGNGMCMADCCGEFAHFRRRGFNVIVAEYIGYGMSSGKPSEQAVYATADACFDFLLQQSDIDKEKIVPFGWSLGSAAAVYLASTRHTPALVTVSAFTSVTEMARHLFPYLPTSLILRHHFDNESKLRAIRAPVFIGHGTHDSIVPFFMSKKLAEAAGGKVTQFDVEDGDHNNVFDVGGEEFHDAITRFIEDSTIQ
jgi:fermentation-respiration switch protein FrsA (DUF1100 family)